MPAQHLQWRVAQPCRQPLPKFRSQKVDARIIVCRRRWTFRQAAGCACYGMGASLGGNSTDPMPAWCGIICRDATCCGNVYARHSCWRISCSGDPGAARTAGAARLLKQVQAEGTIVIPAKTQSSSGSPRPGALARVANALTLQLQQAARPWRHSPATAALRRGTNSVHVVTPCAGFGMGWVTVEAAYGTSTDRTHLARVERPHAQTPDRLDAVD